jgi:heptosyltransferase I
MILPRSLSPSYSLPKNASVCILRLSAIGDVCHAVSMVARIREHRPDISIVWVVGKIEYSLLAGMDGVEFVVYDKKAGKKAREHVKAAVAGRKFDALCVMQVALRANWLSRVINADIRLGFDKSHSKEGHSLFINRRIAKLVHPHVLEGFHAFADALGIAKSSTLTWPIAVSKDDEQFADSIKTNVGKFVAICPAASKLERSWDPERYAEIAKYIRGVGYSVVLCGGPGPLDKQLETQIQSYFDEPLPSLVGKTSLKQMFCVLGEADAVIAPDTGPAHMATAAGTPVIGLYAHSNPRRTGPYMSLDNTVNVYDSHIKAQTGKSWNELKWGTRAKGDTLMSDISVESVKAMVDKVLGK